MLFFYYWKMYQKADDWSVVNEQPRNQYWFISSDPVIEAVVYITMTLTLPYTERLI